MRNDAELAEAIRVRDYVAEINFNGAAAVFASRTPKRAAERLEKVLNDLRAGKLPREYPNAKIESPLRA